MHLTNEVTIRNNAVAMTQAAAMGQQIQMQGMAMQQMQMQQAQMQAANPMMAPVQGQMYVNPMQQGYPVQSK
jgi:roadblock/LC7 domain-containing protein